MAEKRMFSMSIMDSDAFLEMPLSSQALYVHLGIRADDDGFVRSPKMIQRSVGCAEDDLKILIAKNFIIPFESGVVAIKHWHINNYIRKDRYKPTVYQEECRMLYIKPNRAYTLDCTQGLHYVNHKETVGLPSGIPDGKPSGIPVGTPVGIPSGIPDGTPSGTPSGIPSGIPDGNHVVDSWYTQNRIDKNRIDKNNINNIIDNSISAPSDDWTPADSPTEVSSSKKKKDESPVVIQLMLNDKSLYDIHQSQVDEWTGLYPSVDVMQELRNMVGWIKSNPNKRKTRTGILRFCTAWLSREQNKGHMRMLNPVGGTGVAINPNRDDSLDGIF